MDTQANDPIPWGLHGDSVLRFDKFEDMLKFIPYKEYSLSSLTDPGLHKTDEAFD